MAALRYPLKLFYDASCPMCANEMQALKCRDRHGRLELVDCSAPDFDDSVLLGTMMEHRDLMTLIHARDAHGRWLVGIEVFEAAYGAVGLAAIAGFWGSRMLRPLLRRLYPWIARNRQALSRVGFNRLVKLMLPIPCREHHGGSTCRASPSAARPRSP